MKEIIEDVYACTDCNHKKSCDRIIYEQQQCPSIAVILQNPGPPPDEIKEAENETLLGMNYSEKSAYHSGELKKWILSTSNGNQQFFFRFFSILYRNMILRQDSRHRFPRNNQFSRNFFIIIQIFSKSSILSIKKSYINKFSLYRRT